MLSIRRKLPRIFAPPLAALFICSVFAPLACAAQIAGQNSPAPMQKSALDAPARELARRVAASLPGGTRVTIEVRNQSSLSEDDASVLRTTMADELSARGLRTSGEGPGAASIVVTLSEDVQGYVWVAQIQHGDDTSVLLQQVSRETASATPPESEKIVLRKELLWSGPAHVLDAAAVPTSGSVPTRVVLVEIDGVSAYVTDSLGTFRTELPVAVSNPRDPGGVLVFWVNPPEFEVIARDPLDDWEGCTFKLGTAAAQECGHPIIEERDLMQLRPPLPPAMGDQEAAVSSPCADGGVVLGAAKGDYTQPDNLLAYAAPGKGKPLSAPVTFPGPVVRLSGDFDRGTAIAVIKNLENTNYEVYRITVACGQ